jgi:hypothetical protein
VRYLFYFCRAFICSPEIFVHACGFFAAVPQCNYVTNRIDAFSAAQLGLIMSHVFLVPLMLIVRVPLRLMQSTPSPRKICSSLLSVTKESWCSPFHLILMNPCETKRRCRLNASLGPVWLAFHSRMHHINLARRYTPLD